MKKKRPIKNTWYDYLNHYIAVSITRSADSFEDKIVSFFKAPKKTVYGKGKKLSKPKTKNTRKKKKEHQKKEKNIN